MRARVFYVNLTEAQRRMINEGDWGTPVGREYLEARAGKRPNSYLYQLAAEVDVFTPDAEVIWMGMQNMERPWTEKSNHLSLNIEAVHTDFPRSMDVGDKIVWEDGRIELVDSVGFKTVEVK